MTAPYYRLQWEVHEYDPSKAQDIIVAMNEDFAFLVAPHEVKTTQSGDDSWTHIIVADGEDQIVESPEDFLQEIYGKIWRANGGYCRIEVYLHYLELCPFDFFEQGKSEYDAWFAEQETEDGDGSG